MEHHFHSHRFCSAERSCLLAVLSPQAATTWEVSDGDRGFVSDIYIRLEIGKTISKADLKSLVEET